MRGRALGLRGVLLWKVGAEQTGYGMAWWGEGGLLLSPPSLPTFPTFLNEDSTSSVAQRRTRDYNYVLFVYLIPKGVDSLVWLII